MKGGENMEVGTRYPRSRDRNMQVRSNNLDCTRVSANRLQLDIRQEPRPARDSMSNESGQQSTASAPRGKASKWPPREINFREYTASRYAPVT